MSASRIPHDLIENMPILGAGEGPERMARIHPDTADEIAAFANEYAYIFDLVAAAQPYDQFDFSFLDPANSDAFDISLLGRARALARTLELQGLHAQALEDHDLVTTSVLSVFHLASALEHEPTLIATMLRAQASRRAADAGLAVEHFRLSHDRWPDDLDEVEAFLDQTLPRDPYTGGPLRYHITDAGVVIYSVGDNFTDDGGHQRWDNNPDHPDARDITFRLYHPDQRNTLPPVHHLDYLDNDEWMGTEYYGSQDEDTYEDADEDD